MVDNNDFIRINRCYLISKLNIVSIVYKKTNAEVQLQNKLNKD